MAMKPLPVSDAFETPGKLELLFSSGVQARMVSQLK